jgi:hypothetical protein
MRLATNLEIFWDRLGWAVARPDVELRTRRIAPAHADLAYRGFSITDQPSPSVPERPRYQVVSTVPQWRDLEGYYTRFGDVLPLLRGVDDRYVIMNAGDELRLSFPEPAAPRAGWTRDFVLAGDGWEKDGDYNTSFSDTVLPLPSHDRPDYGGDVRATHASPLPLEEDPVYLRHAQDWQTYHTRFVAPGAFLRGLRDTH